MTDVALVVLRLALAAVFFTAAGAKAFQQESFQGTLKEFGVRAPGLMRGLAMAIPAVEALLGVGLLAAPTAWLASIGALLLLATLTAAVAANLAKGRRPACNCFGQLRAKPIGASTVVRNLVLIAMAAGVAAPGAAHAQPGILAAFAGSPLGWLAASGTLAAAIVMATQFWLIFQLMRQQGRLLVRLDTLETTLGNVGVVPAAAEHAAMVGLPPGSLAPAFAGTRVDGREVTLAQLRQRAGALMLVFSDPNCGPCTALLPQLAAWHEQLAGRADIVVVSNGPVADIRAKFAGMDRLLDNVVVQQDNAIMALFQSRATPSAVLVNRLGLLDSYVAVGGREIEALMPQLAAIAPGGAPVSRERVAPVPQDAALAVRA